MVNCYLSGFPIRQSGDYCFRYKITGGLVLLQLPSTVFVWHVSIFQKELTSITITTIWCRICFKWQIPLTCTRCHATLLNRYRILFWLYILHIHAFINIIYWIFTAGILCSALKWVQQEKNHFFLPIFIK